MFRVPTTHDVLTTLLHPGYRKSHLDLLNLGLLSLQLILFFVLPRNIGRIFFFFYLAFWRTAYDAGLGWMLTKQSKRKWMVKEVQRRGWLDEKRRPQVREWIRTQLQDKMGKDYSFDLGDGARNRSSSKNTTRLGATSGVQYLVSLPSTGQVSSDFLPSVTVVI